jgi:hypothetical protein
MTRADAVANVPEDRRMTWAAIFQACDTVESLNTAVSHAVVVEGPLKALAFLAKALDATPLGQLLSAAVLDMQASASDRFALLMKRACVIYDVSSVDILGANRSQRIIAARHAVMYVARTHLELDLSEIGRRMNRDHSTVIHAVSMISAASAFSARLIQLIDLTKGDTAHVHEGRAAGDGAPARQSLTDVAPR